MLRQLAILQDQFRATLPERMAAIKNAAYQALEGDPPRLPRLAELRRLAHGLAGAAGTFGQARLSEAAQRLEKALGPLLGDDTPTAVSLDGVRQQLAELAAAATAAHVEDRMHTPDPAARIAAENRVVVVEEDTALADAIADRLEMHGYQVDHFPRLEDFQAACSRGGPVPEAIILDVIAAEDASAGLRAIQELRLQCLGARPVMFISDRDDMETRLAALRAGANRFLVKPLDLEELARVVDSATLRKAETPFRVLLADSDTDILSVHAAVLEAAGMRVETVAEPLRVHEAAVRFRPDCLVLDLHLPEGSGEELAAVLRSDARFLNMPILFLSAEEDEERQLHALDMGADAVLRKPVDPRHLVGAIVVRARRARELQRLQHDLRASLRESRFQRQALDHHAIVSITDASGAIAFANDRFCKVSGYRRSELLGQNHRLLKSGLHSPAFYEELWRTISHGRVWHGELCNRRKDGSLYWVESTIVPFLDEAGIPSRYISVRTEITALKETEQALRRSEERLRQSQAYANIGTWDWDIRSGALYWSDRIAPLCGYADGSLETTYENFLNSVHAEDQQRVAAAVNACVERGARYDIEHRCVWPDGSVRWLLERGGVTRDEAGRPLHMLGVVQDITAHKTLERDLYHAKELAERASRAKSDFLSSMSHELRTPMNAVLGFAQLLDIDPAVGAAQRESVHEILRAGRHLLELINEVLDLARVEAGRLQLSIEPVECAALLEESAALVLHLADRRGITLDKRDGDCAGTSVLADRTRLRQVLINLLSNAVKYNREGGRITLSSQRLDERMRFSVADTGAGIPRERQGEVFQAFNRLGAERGSVEGTGIGLVISKQLVEMMDGAIGFVSTPGEGSVFWVEVPLARLDAPARAISGEAPAAAAVAARGTVLYVEDNPANLRLMAHLIGSRPGLRLVTAHAPGLGLDLARSHLPDLILLDINLPDMDGFAVLGQLRAEPGLRHRPVVAISANAMERDIDKALAAGFDAYITKPIDVPRFMGLLERYLPRSASPAAGKDGND